VTNMVLAPARQPGPLANFFGL